MFAYIPCLNVDFEIHTRNLVGTNLVILWICCLFSDKVTELNQWKTIEEELLQQCSICRAAVSDMHARAHTHTHYLGWFLLIFGEGR